MKPIAATLRLASTVACLVIVASFAMWAADQGDAASQEQVARVQDGAPFVPPVPLSGEKAREQRHGGAAEKVNDVSDVLVQPFADAGSGSTNEWVQHGIPVLLSLLAYGLLLRLLVNYLPVTPR
jgi:hypothetical protein